MIRSLVRTIVALEALVVATAGCGNSESTEPTDPVGGPFQGASLKAAVPAGSGLSDAWQSLRIEWSARTGAEVAVVEPPADAGAVLRVFPATEFGALVAGGALAPIPADVQEQSALDWNDFPAGVAAIASIERVPTAVPIACPTFVLYARGDLLEKAGLAQPKTWGDYTKLLESLDRWAPGLAAVEPWGETSRSALFLSRAAPLARHPGNFSLFFDIETGDPLIASPAFVRALDAARADLARLSKNVTGMSPADCRGELLAGKAALAIAWETPSTPGDAVDGSEFERSDDLRVAVSRLPGSRAVYDRSLGRWDELKGDDVNRAGVVGFAGTFAGVSAAAKPLESQAAWNLLEVLLEPANAPLAFPGAMRGPCRTSAVGTPSEFVSRGLTASEAIEYVSAIEQTLRDPKLVAALPVPGHADFMASLSKGLTRALAGDEPSETILRDIEREWTALVDRLGRDRIRDTYRRTLGLRPLPKN